MIYPNDGNLLYEYYLNQAGSGIGTIYTGPAFQTGHGVGSFLAKFYRTVLPYLKKGVKRVGKEFFKVGSDVMEDIHQPDVSIKDSLKKRGQEAFDRLTTGSGYKRIIATRNDHSSIKRVRRKAAEKSIQLSLLQKNNKVKSLKKRRNKKDLFDN